MGGVQAVHEKLTPIPLVVSAAAANQDNLPAPTTSQYCLKGELLPSQKKFYKFHVPKELLVTKHELIIRCKVLTGRILGIYSSPDKSFPSQRRKVWSCEVYCRCSSSLCSHSYPSCINIQGGLCTQCCTHDEAFTKYQHDARLGGLAFDKTNTNEAVINKKGDEVYSHQSDWEFALRFSVEDLEVVIGSDYYVTVLAAPENPDQVTRARRRQQGLDELHQTTYQIWLEEREGQKELARGNEKRLAEIQNDIALKAEVKAKTQEQNKVMEEKVNATKEEYVFKLDKHDGIGKERDPNKEEKEFTI